MPRTPDSTAVTNVTAPTTARSAGLMVVTPSPFGSLRLPSAHLAGGGAAVEARGQRSDVALARPDQPRDGALLFHVREPARHAPRREHRAEERARHAQRVEQHGRVELDVGA